jgi:hypothetical protein
MTVPHASAVGGLFDAAKAACMSQSTQQMADSKTFSMFARPQGCGLVVFSQHSEAAAAMETLHGRFVWPGARSPIVIEWCDPNKQHKKKRAQPLAHPYMTQQYPVHMQQAQQVPQMQQVPRMQQVQYVQQHLPLQQPQQPALMVQGGMPVMSHQDLGMQVVYVKQHFNQHAY